MDPIKLEKIEAMKKYKKKMHQYSSIQKSTKEINNSAFVVYTLTALTCSLVFFSPFWYPTLESIFTVSIPSLISQFLIPKYLFIVGNLIVFVLVGESKLLSSKPSEQVSGEVYYDEYVSRSSQSLKQRPATANLVRCSTTASTTTKTGEVKRSVGRSKSVRKIELVKELENNGMVRTMSAEELSKRADDFIARVNRQRMIEATDLVEWNI